MQNKISYPVILDESDGYVLVKIPDFEATSGGWNVADACYNAWISIVGLCDYLHDNDKEIPASSADIDGNVVMIDVWLGEKYE